MMCRCLIVACLLLQAITADSAELSVIPLPNRIEPMSGSFDVNRETKLLVGDPRAEASARYFGDLLFQVRGFRPEIVQSTATQPAKRSMLFTIDVDAAAGSPEGYDLDITSKSIRLAANDARGLMYGAITLWQLLSTSAEKDDEVSVAAMRIKDAPRMQWRGLLLDSARSSQSVEFIKHFIDNMAVHKLNMLHWHLVDDQAWRVEIRKYPKLTAARGKQPVYYTQNQVREIVEHAAKRNVTIVPGLEMPGHATAALLAYPQLGTAAPVTNRSESSNLYGVEEPTFEFFDGVLAEIAELFPGPFVHIGASDVNKEQWSNSPSVQQRMKQLNVANEQRLQRYFLERVSAMLTQRNRRLVGWDGALSGGLASNSVITTGKGIDGALSAAASGFDVIVSSYAALNLDRRQASATPGQSLPDKLVSLEDMYGFDPIPEGLSDQERKRMIGLQANLWTTGVDTEERIETMAFPRAAAVAEIAWTNPSRGRRWSSFLERLAPQFGRYASIGLKHSDAAFRVMVIPRGMMSQDRVRIELAKQTPLGEIRYSVNGAELNPRSSAYADVFEVVMPAVVKATTYLNGVPLAEPVTMQVDRTSVAQAGSN